MTTLQRVGQIRTRCSFRAQPLVFGYRIILTQETNFNNLKDCTRTNVIRFFF